MLNCLRIITIPTTSLPGWRNLILWGFCFTHIAHLVKERFLSFFFFLLLRSMTHCMPSWRVWKPFSATFFCGDHDVLTSACCLMLLLPHIHPKIDRQIQKVVIKILLGSPPLVEIAFGALKNKLRFSYARSRMGNFRCSQRNIINKVFTIGFRGSN